MTLTKQEVTVTEQSGTSLSNYQVKITFGAGDTIFSEAASDGSDVRFYDEDDSTLLDHYIESFNPSGESATIWVKVPSISASSTKTLYLYYGDGQTIQTSDGYATFDYFNPDGDLSNWTTHSGTPTTSSSEGNPAPSIEADNNTTQDAAYVNAGLSAPIVIEYDQLLVGTSRSIGNLFFLADSNGVGQAYNLDTVNNSGDKTDWYTTTGWGSWNIDSVVHSPASKDTWYSIKLEVGPSTVTAFRNGTAGNTTYAYSDNGGYIGINSDGGDTHTTYFDNIRARQYASTEPSTSLGSTTTFGFVFKTTPKNIKETF